MKDARAEMVQLIYEKLLYPKNRDIDKVPGNHAQAKEKAIDQQVVLLQTREK